MVIIAFLSPQKYYLMLMINPLPPFGNSQTSSRKKADARSLLAAIVIGITLCGSLHAQTSDSQDISATPQPLAQSEKEIPVFYQGTEENLNKFRLQLEQQLTSKMPGNTFHFVDISGKNKIDVQKNLTNANQCAMAIGPYATQKMLTARKPIRYFSVQTSRNLLDKLHQVYQPLGIGITGIYEEQPFVRQVFLARAMEPSLSSVGLLLDQQDKYFLAEYQQAAQKQAVDLQYRILSSADSPEKFLGEVSSQGGYMLLTNNSHLYMKSKLAALVLSAYYQRIKLIGNRLEDTQTGTLASIYTPMTTLVIEAVNDFKDQCEGGQITNPRYAKSFGVIINRQIATNLGLGEFDINRLSKQITQMENLR